MTADNERCPMSIPDEAAIRSDELAAGGLQPGRRPRPVNADDLRATAADIRAAVSGVEPDSKFELAVADWLECLGDTLGDDPSNYCGGEGHPMWSASSGIVYADCHSWFCENVDKAFAVVKAWRWES